MKFKIGDLARYGPSPTGALGMLVQKLQWSHQEEKDYLNWDGEPAWWIQFFNDGEPTWCYEEEITLVSKGN